TTSLRSPSPSPPPLPPRPPATYTPLNSPPPGDDRRTAPPCFLVTSPPRCRSWSPHSGAPRGSGPHPIPPHPISPDTSGLRMRMQMLMLMLMLPLMLGRGGNPEGHDEPTTTMLILPDKPTLHKEGTREGGRERRLRLDLVIVIGRA
ncbi:hypothetical protein KC19_9G012000, partial [Ceratodon purpureus]